MGALAWALIALRKERSRTRQHQTAAAQLSEALKSAEGAAWFGDFCEHVARKARDAPASGRL